MKENIDAYHIAEKQEAVFMLLWGGGWFLLAIVILIYAKEELYVGAAYSTLPLSFLQAMGGCRNLLTYYNRYKQLNRLLVEHWREVAQTEKLRVLNIQIRLKFYKLAEQILFTIGLLFLLLGGLLGWSVFIVGSGIGLLMMSVILLIQDLFAEWRSSIYLSELQSFIDDE